MKLRVWDAGCISLCEWPPASKQSWCCWRSLSPSLPCGFASHLLLLQQAVSFSPVPLPVLHSSRSGWSPLTPLPPGLFSKLMTELQGTLEASNLTSTDSESVCVGGHALAQLILQFQNGQFILLFRISKDFKEIASASPKIPFVSLTALRDCLPWLQNYGCHF